MEDTKKPGPPPAESAARAGADSAGQPYETMGAGVRVPEHPPTPGLSFTPDLEDVPDSQVPGYGHGGMVSHVQGPQQNACDPIAAGLDTKHKPVTRNEARAVTLTGAEGAGPGPSTYDEKPGGFDVKDRTDATHETVPYTEPHAPPG